MIQFHTIISISADIHVHDLVQFASHFPEAARGFSSTIQATATFFVCLFQTNKTTWVFFRAEGQICCSGHRHKGHKLSAVNNSCHGSVGLIGQERWKHLFETLSYGNVSHCRSKEARVRANAGKRTDRWAHRFGRNRKFSVSQWTSRQNYCLINVACQHSHWMWHWQQCGHSASITELKLQKVLLPNCLKIWFNFYTGADIPVGIVGYQ